MKPYTGPAYRFRSDVVLALHRAGFQGARTWLDEAGNATGEHVRGDIFGLPLTIATRNQRDLDFAEALREVEAEALEAGTKLFVSIQARKTRTTGEAYATTTLDNFMQLLAMAFPSKVAAASAPLLGISDVESTGDGKGPGT